MKKMFWIVSLLILIALPASSHAIGLEVAVGGWYQDPGGDLSYKGLIGTDTLSVENDLKYDSAFRFTGRAKIDMPLFIPNIYLMATPMSFDATGTKSTTFKFGDFNFTQDVDFYSKVDLTHYDIGFYYGIPFVQTATAKKLNVDVGLNFRIIDFSAEVRQDATGLSESESLVAPLPMVYLGVQVKPVKRFSIEGELRALMLGNNSYYSLVARLKAKIFGPAFAAVGYRYDVIDIDESDVRFDATIDGFFFEAGVEF